ncbi:histidine phosphatase family protein [archaeon]|nr:histidine phosphatase family protein [Nanoarchaeota archaeon]MBU4452216.1 histidine phosphatase family protein [Nanoarchaeota archaeon]MCG2724568.1 histidine phosphatase family protein [archaeon]
MEYDLKTVIDERLGEKNFGIFYGLTDKEIKKRNLLEYRRWSAEGRYRYRPPEGESYIDVRARIEGFMKDKGQDWNGKNVLVITHQVPYKMFRAIIEGLDEEAVLNLPHTPNCGIQEYQLRGGKLELS